MIDKSVFNKDYILELQNKYNVDPSILERSIYALGLVEALVKSQLNFIFKGGSSLMLLLKKPLRLSTDVDIIVSPSVDIINTIQKASVIYPFIRFEEDIRITKNKINKRHFVFYYESLYKPGKETPILLDVLFEENHYPKLLNIEIKTDFIKTTGEKISVNVPTAESILGDKLTAFAPKTIGVKPMEERKDGKFIDKRVETIKQFFDVASLFDSISNFDEVKTSYIATANTELMYREAQNLTYIDCLKDTFEAALTIITKGKYNPEDYIYYLDGIRSLSNFLINTRFNAETAYTQAAKVMYLSACFLSNTNPEDSIESQELVKTDYAKNINIIRKIDINSFNMAAKAIKLFQASINNK